MKNTKATLNALARKVIKSKVKKHKKPKLPDNSQKMSLPGVPGSPTPSPIKLGDWRLPKTLGSPLPKPKLLKTKKLRDKKLPKGMVASKQITVPKSPLTVSP